MRPRLDGSALASFEHELSYTSMRMERFMAAVDEVLLHYYFYLVGMKNS